jgi:hypothetical protein
MLQIVFFDETLPNRHKKETPKNCQNKHIEYIELFSFFLNNQISLEDKRFKT